jgi:hypothetical protein
MNEYHLPYDRLPCDLWNFCILPFLTLVERRRLPIHFERSLIKCLLYCRDIKKQCVIVRPISYLNQITLPKNSNHAIIRMDDGNFRIRNRFFQSFIIIHRRNYNGFSSFYFENRFHFNRATIHDTTKEYICCLLEHSWRESNNIGVPPDIIFFNDNHNCSKDIICTIASQNLRCAITDDVLLSSGSSWSFGPRQSFNDFLRFNYRIEMNLRKI